MVSQGTRWRAVFLCVAMGGGVAGCNGGSEKEAVSGVSEESPTAGKETAEAAEKKAADPSAGKAPAETGGKGAAGDAGGEEQPHPALLDPSLADETAPDTFRAEFETTKGDFVIEVHRDWAPRGADRFYNLVKIGFYDGIRFFRVLKSPRPFMAQFGISGDPEVSARWQDANIEDDPVKQSNQRGYVTYAKTRAPDSRSTQVFINYSDNSFLDDQGFAPFGKVVEGMDVVDALYGGYGEGAPRGSGPDQGRIQAEGTEYLEESFPKLDYIKNARIVEEG